MKYTERRSGLYFENISREEVRFANLAGRLTGSVYEDPSKPQHVYVLWINPEHVDILRGMNFNVKEVNEYDRIMHSENEDLKNRILSDPEFEQECKGLVRYSMQLKAYPKMRVNRSTGKEEQYPKVMMRTIANTVPLAMESFGLIDSAHISSVDIRFHGWQYGKGPEQVAVIDELWLTVDESAGEIDEGYLSEKYAQPPVMNEEELPFV